MRTLFNWAQLWPKPYAGTAMLHDQGAALLNQLRELRATLAGHTVRLNRVEEHVDRIDGQLRDIHLLVARALEAAARRRLRPRDDGAVGEDAARDQWPEEPREPRAAEPQEPRSEERRDGRRDAGADERERLEDRVSHIERRLARVEESLHG